MTTTQLAVIADAATRCAVRGLVTKNDILAVAAVIGETSIDSDAVIAAVSQYGYDANAADTILTALKNGVDTRVTGNVIQSYVAASAYVLLVARRGYNRGELSELATAILAGVFPEYGIANSRPAIGGVADLVIANYSCSCKDIAARCTFVHGDSADALIATLGNYNAFYVLTRATWAKLEASYSEYESSRGTYRSPRSKGKVEEMVEWLNAKAA